MAIKSRFAVPMGEVSLMSAGAWFGVPGSACCGCRRPSRAGRVSAWSRCRPWAITMLKRRRLAIGPGVEPVFPDSLGGWRDPANVRRVWRQVRDGAELDDLVSHTLRKTVASFLDECGSPEDQRPARPRQDQHDAGPVSRAPADRPADRRGPGGQARRRVENCPKTVL